MRRVESGIKNTSAYCPWNYSRDNSRSQRFRWKDNVSCIWKYLRSASLVLFESFFSSFFIFLSPFQIENDSPTVVFHKKKINGAPIISLIFYIFWWYRKCYKCWYSCRYSRSHFFILLLFLSFFYFVNCFPFNISLFEYCVLNRNFIAGYCTLFNFIPSLCDLIFYDENANILWLLGMKLLLLRSHIEIIIKTNLY